MSGISTDIFKNHRYKNVFWLIFLRAMGQNIFNHIFFRDHSGRGQLILPKTFETIGINNCEERRRMRIISTYIEKVHRDLKFKFQETIEAKNRYLRIFSKETCFFEILGPRRVDFETDFLTILEIQSYIFIHIFSKAHRPYNHKRPNFF